MFIIIIK